jgi:general secretion pathway protein K
MTATGQPRPVERAGLRPGPDAGARRRAGAQPGAPRRSARGAALLLAMMILALVTTVTAGMVWHQRKAIEVEAAERARVQATWILRGALDWARLILREDQRAAQRRNSPYTWGRDAWGTPLAEASLSSFLAADKSNNADGDLDATISGAIVDAQRKFNLRQLVDAQGKPLAPQVAGLQRLADQVGMPADTASRLAEALGKAQAPAGDAAAAGGWMRPERLADLVWLGIAAETLERLAPYVDLLPAVTPVNLNTAPREVLLAAVDGLDLPTAERLVQQRLRAPYVSIDGARALVSAAVKFDEARVGVASQWFEVSGRLRLAERVVEERSLLQREGDRVTVRRRERHSFDASGG